MGGLLAKLDGIKTVDKKRITEEQHRRNCESKALASAALAASGQDLLNDQQGSDAVVPTDVNSFLHRRHGQDFLRTLQMMAPADTLTQAGGYS